VSEEKTTRAHEIVSIDQDGTFLYGFDKYLGLMMLLGLIVMNMPTGWQVSYLVTGSGMLLVEYYRYCQRTRSGP
jgi:hypothetical protein